MQGLRDSPLHFDFHRASSTEPQEVAPATPSGLTLVPKPIPRSETSAPLIPVIPLNLAKDFEVFDSIQLIQHLKSQSIEFEKSDAFQELLERMTLSLKRKAKIKGADALGEIKTEVSILQFPDQYQIMISAQTLRKKS
jgi:hypothetical protein